MAEPVEATPAEKEEPAPDADGKKDEESEKEAPKKEMANFVGEGDSCHFPDWIFSLAWICSVIIVVYLAWDYGFPSLENLESLLSQVSESRHHRPLQPTSPTLSRRLVHTHMHTDSHSTWMTVRSTSLRPPPECCTFLSIVLAW